ncbi:Putative methyltransferase [Legionella busanensis]|uniref:Methyltransferase n=1 Tax=Legionella busanensis TaxID=190655 RepID=A0A378JI68_9GAMM|nr:class I SAM-dependent methyltransferase [Legionella busanensis]STX50885.1 Putative methyltransferase [Legionella busanensis]
MLNAEWPAQDYAVGSYIQATIADHLLSSLQLKPTDDVLDIGCGDGNYTRKILDKVPQGSVLGIDASENMLSLAQDVCKDYSNFAVQKNNVLDMSYTNQFDQVVSFWCLQWATDIKKAFTNIVRALKPGGQIFTIFPAGDDPYIMAYYAIKESGKFASLRHFEAPVDYKELNNLATNLANIPCKRINVDLIEESLVLPNLEIFKKFVNGIAFYQGQISNSEIKLINEAMVNWYEKKCQEYWQGIYKFNLSLYLVTGEK